ncbi:MAG: LPS export ABC transporter periplasmic protein LptC [Bdellovibrionales bacterium]
MKNRLVQIALSLALLVLLIQMVLIAPSQIRDAEDKAALIPAPQMETGNEIDQSIQGMHMIETQEGKKEWELWADQAMSLKAKDILELTAVKSLFFSDSGVTFKVTGEKGRVQVKSKDMRVEGNVVIRSSNGYTFRTPVAEYTSQTRQLMAPENVEMLGPKDGKGYSLRLTGKGMEASLENSTMEVLSEVKAEKTIDEGRKAFIRSHRAVFSGKNRIARFRGNVVLDMDNMRITGPEAHFLWDPEREAVKSVEFVGGAKVSDTEKWATARNVRVDFDTNRLVFKGSPRVVQNNDELHGEEIIFIDGGKQVQVKSARAKVDQKTLEEKE